MKLKTLKDMGKETEGVAKGRYIDSEELREEAVKRGKAQIFIIQDKYESYYNKNKARGALVEIKDFFNLTGEDLE